MEMKTLNRIWLGVFLLCILFFMMCCTESEEPSSSFDITGKWIGRPWVCSNECAIKSIDWGSTMSLEISEVKERGVLDITDGIRYMPSCELPYCVTPVWRVLYAAYNDEILEIQFTTGYVFIGALVIEDRSGFDYAERFRGWVLKNDLIWNEDVVFERF